MKRCSRCAQVMPVGDFSRQASARDGLRSQCRSCCAEMAREYRRAHPDQVRQRQAAWLRTPKGREAQRRGAAKYRAKPEKATLIANARRRRTLTPEQRERRKEYGRAWRARPENQIKETERRQTAEYKAKKRIRALRHYSDPENRARMIAGANARNKTPKARARRRRWEKSDPKRRAKRHRLEHQRRHRLRARDAGAACGRVTVEQEQQRWRLFAGRCWMCGGVAVEWEHVKPGVHVASNLRPSCRKCNWTKGASWPWPQGRPLAYVAPRTGLPA